MRSWTLFTFRSHANDIRGFCFDKIRITLPITIDCQYEANFDLICFAVFSDRVVRITALLQTQSCVADTVFEFLAASKIAQIKALSNCLVLVTRLCRVVLK